MRFPRVLVLTLLTLLVASLAFGQGTGTTSNLGGTVTTEGKALPGATVSITSPALQGVRTTVSGEGGGYNFPGLPPGVYTVTYELEGMQKVTKKVTLALATSVREDTALHVASMTEAITVTASAPAVMETNEMTRNFDQKVIQTLPVRRNVRDTVLLAPGVNSNGPNNQITISGAPSFDNLFLVNGVVVNENLRGQPHNLFIEDAIQETTVLTGGAVSAEYGRFTGGVVSTITKSGGNEFNGTLRDSITNPSWISKSAFRDKSGNPEADHPDVKSNIYEGTLGGFVMRDRLWFFAAGRHTKGAPANGFNAQVSTLTTNIPFLNTLDEDRYEGKLTGQITSKHTVVASYLNVKTTENNNFFAPIYDENSIVTQRQLPNSLKAIAYNGIITSSLLIEGQASQKKFAFVGSGGIYTDAIRGTWISDANARWNAPVFCGVCTDEERNNDSGVLKATYFLNTRSLGTHNIVGGGEIYKETRLVNNNQSASGFTIASTGTASFLPGDPTPYPHFDNNTQINWRPILVESTGSHLNTKSLFVNDKWDFTSKWSFNVGLRYDKNHALDASNNVVSDDSAISPRLGAMFDLKGDGRTRFNFSYGRYVTKIVDGNVGGAGNAAGTPARFTWRYLGPSVNPLQGGNIVGTPVGPQAALKILFDWFASRGGTDKFTDLLSSSIPGFTQRIEDPITSPSVRELNVGVGQRFGNTGFARVDLIDRKWKDFYALHLDQGTGIITAPAPANTRNDLALLVNDNSIKRRYKAAQLTFGWRPGKLNVGGGYTLASLRGSDTTESDGSASSPIQALALFYPEYMGYSQRIPEGYLYGDQRHRAKVWAGYDLALPIGSLNASVIQSADSGRAFSAVGQVTVAQNPATGANTYTRSQLPAGADYYFSDRGAFRTPSVFATDLSLNYNLPTILRTQVFIQAQVLNVFNNSEISSIVGGQLDTNVFTSRSGKTGTNGQNAFKAFNPHNQTPIECPAGASFDTCQSMNANWQLASRPQDGDVFGTGLSKDAYQTPRTYRFAVGLRF